MRRCNQNTEDCIVALQKQQRSTTKIVYLVPCPTYTRVPQSDTEYLQHFWTEELLQLISLQAIELRSLETGFEKSFFMFPCLYLNYTPIPILPLSFFYPFIWQHQVSIVCQGQGRLKAVLELIVQERRYVHILSVRNCQQLQKRFREYSLGIRDCFLLGAKSGKAAWTSLYHKECKKQTNGDENLNTPMFN